MYGKSPLAMCGTALPSQSQRGSLISHPKAECFEHSRWQRGVESCLQEGVEGGWVPRLQGSAGEKPTRGHSGSRPEKGKETACPLEPSDATCGESGRDSCRTPRVGWGQLHAPGPAPGLAVAHGGIPIETMVSNWRGQPRLRTGRGPEAASCTPGRGTCCEVL